jgi:hypothetical protein
MGFGLFAWFNPAVVIAMAVGAVCLSAAIFPIRELNSPYSGVMRLSDTPLHMRWLIFSSSSEAGYGLRLRLLCGPKATGPIDTGIAL